MDKMFEIRFVSWDSIFVKGKDSYGEDHVFLCDDFDAVAKLIKNWVEKGYDFIGDHEYSFAMNAFEFCDEELFKNDKWALSEEEEAFKRGIL